MMKRILFPVPGLMTRRLLLRRWPLLLLSLLFLSVCTGCGNHERFYTLMGMNHTTFQIKYRYAGALDDEIKAAFKAYYHSINPFDSLSILSRVNRNEAVEVDSLFAHIFCTAQEVSEQTDGMFDVTCAPLINLWGFGFERYDSVSPRIVDSIRAFVGYRKVRLEAARVLKEDSRIQLNFSALGDGSICDVIADLLDRKGVEDYMIDVGGEVVVKGLNPQGEGWRIGIVKPVDDASCTNSELKAVVQFGLSDQKGDSGLSDRKGLATSGDYRNFYLKDGKKIAHTVNPLSGYPAAQDILSATVVADCCIIADAYATAFMALGRHGMRQLVSKHPELDYYIIYTDSVTGRYRTECSEGMKRYLLPEGGVEE